MNYVIKSVNTDSFKDISQLSEINYIFYQEYMIYREMLQNSNITPDREKVLYLYKRVTEYEKEIRLEYNMSHDLQRTQKERKLLQSYKEDTLRLKGYIADILLLEL